MLVTKANKLVSDYHDRMPMLLGLGRHGRWLEADTKAQVFRPAPDGYLQVWPVSRRVNNSRAAADDPTLIERIAA